MTSQFTVALSANLLTTHDLALTRCTHHSLPLIQQMYSPRMAIHSAIVLTTYGHSRRNAFSHISHTICLGPCICLVSSCKDMSFILVLDYVPAHFLFTGRETSSDQFILPRNRCIVLDIASLFSTITDYVLVEQRALKYGCIGLSLWVFKSFNVHVPGICHKQYRMLDVVQWDYCCLGQREMCSTISIICITTNEYASLNVKVEN